MDFVASSLRFSDYQMQLQLRNTAACSQAGYIYTYIFCSNLRHNGRLVLEQHYFGYNLKTAERREMRFIITL